MMKGKSWSDLNKAMSSSTKIYVLVAVSIGIGSFIFNAWSTNWTLTILVTLAVTLLVEHFWVLAHRHPKTWNTIKWTILLIALALLFLSVELIEWIDLK